MRNFVFMTIFCLAATAGGSEVELSAPSSCVAMTDGPKAVVSGTSIDLGPIPKGKSVQRAVVIENTGTTPLEIAVKTTCGCTVADFDESIAPGGKGNVRVSLQTDMIEGDFLKKVEVTTNDSTLPRFDITFRGKTIAAVSAEGSMLQTVGLPYDVSTVKIVELTTAEGVAIQGATSAKPFLKPSLEQEGSGRYRLLMTISPDVPIGRTAVTVTLNTNADYEPTVLLTLILEKGIHAAPASIEIPSAAVGSANAPRRSTLLRSGSGEFRILAATSSFPGIEVSFESIRNGRIYRLTATASSLPETGEKPVSLIVQTDDPHQRTIEIPVRFASFPSRSRFGSTPSGAR